MSKDQFDKFNLDAKRALVAAQKAARQLNSQIKTEHFLLGIVTTEDTVASEVLRENGISADKINLVLSLSRFISMGGGSGLSSESKRVIERSLEIAKRIGNSEVSPEHLLLAIVNSPDSSGFRTLIEVGADISRIKNQLEKALTENIDAESTEEPSETPPTPGLMIQGGLPNFSPGDLFSAFGPNVAAPEAQKSALEAFTVDMTKRAAEGKLDPIIGREKEIQRVIQILNRRTKNNPVLLGEPGVGKTAIVEGLAQKIVEGNAPGSLAGKKILSLDLGLMIAGTKYRGEFEERIKKVVDKITKSKNVIVFLDEIHTLVGAGSAEGAMDAANILKPALSRGELRLIGATTLDDYRKNIEKDAALERRLQPVKVDEPSMEDTIKILHGLKENYEKHHHVRILNEAILAAVELSKRYIQDRYLPDKAVDLLDEASSMVSLFSDTKDTFGKKIQNKIAQIERAKEAAISRQDFERAAILRNQQEELTKKIRTRKEDTRKYPQITRAHIAKVVSDWTGIPFDNLVRDDQSKFKNLDKILKKFIIGQEEAIEAIAKAIQRTKTGISSEKRPLGSFIFMGPTGVGKTELAKVLAREIFESEDALIKIDMSEFMERHNVSRLIGAPPGYVGYEDAGKLTEAVRRRPYSVVLLDEVEKAHPEVQNILLQILEDGYLTDAKGRKVNFRNAIIIMTSNIGMKELTRSATIGFQESKKKDVMANYPAMKRKVLHDLKEYFRPEFLNRVDKVIVFKPLDQKAILRIVDLQIQELGERIKKSGINIDVSQKAERFIAKKGFDPQNGARPIRRVISDMIEDPLSELILDGKLKKKGKVKVGAGRGKLVLKA
jgi:ATP-dependent Clp protease ATP-binding subunit ClpC